VTTAPEATQIELVIGHLGRVAVPRGRATAGQAPVLLDGHAGLAGGSGFGHHVPAGRPAVRGRARRYAGQAGLQDEGRSVAIFVVWNSLRLRRFRVTVPGTP
jgi:hypothetical protein